MGRLFDAVAALAGIRQRINYEAQAAIEMEVLVDPNEGGYYPFDVSISPNSIQISPIPVIESVVKDLRAHTSVGIIAARFHAGVADMVLRVSMAIRKIHQVSEVALSGGVWQNVVLLRMTLTVPASVDYPAPELVLRDLAGNSASLADYRGQVILVNLWATWCPPCKKEMPAFETYYRRHADDGFVIIAVNDGDPTPDVADFVEEYGLTFPVWLDPTYIATEQAFKTLNLPSSFVIDRNGADCPELGGRCQSSDP